MIKKNKNLGLSAANPEKDLFRNLFDGYNPFIRPVKYSNQSLVVKFELHISHFLKVVGV